MKRYEISDVCLLPMRQVVCRMENVRIRIEKTEFLHSGGSTMLPASGSLESIKWGDLKSPVTLGGGYKAPLHGKWHVDLRIASSLSVRRFR